MSRSTDNLDAGVEPAREEVAVSVIDDDIDADGGIFCEEGLQQRRKPPRADRLVAEQIDALERMIEAHR